MVYYLKDIVHYHNIYDKVVVDFCRKVEKYYREKKPEYIGKRLVTSNICEVIIARHTAEFALNREVAIQKMMIEDSKKDAFLESTSDPEAYCIDCHERMKIESKNLDYLS